MSFEPISLGDQQAQIILEDGDEEFKFTPRQFKQVQGRELDLDKDNPSSLQVSPASNPSEKSLHLLNFISFL